MWLRVKARFFFVSAAFFLVPLLASASSVIPPKDFGELVRISDAVVVARAGASSGLFRGNVVSTGTAFTILEVVKGELRVGQSLSVESPGGVAANIGFAVGGRPEFEEGETYLLTLNRNRGIWVPFMLAYGQLVERRMPTGQRVFTHIEQVHDLEIVQMPGRQVEEIGSYRSADLVPHLKRVAQGGAWDKTTAGVVEELPIMSMLHPAKTSALSAAPAGCDYMAYGGVNIRWTRFGMGQAVSFFTPTAATAANKGLVTTAVNTWKSVPDINVATLTHVGDKVEPPCEGGDAFNQLLDDDVIGIGESLVFFDDPCNQITDLVSCSGVLAIAGPLFSPSQTHSHRGETWITAVKGGMIVNNNLMGCLTQTRLEQTVAHEMGHIIGFGHHTGAAALMNASCCNPVTPLDELCALYVYSDVVINSTPAIASISPTTGAQGQNVVIQILGANFLPASTVSVTGTGIGINNASFVNANRIDLDITIDAGAAATARNIRVTNPAPGGGQSNAAVFTVTAAANPVPTLASVNPDEGEQGQAVAVTLTGSNFVSGSTVNVGGTGVSVSNVTYVNATTLTATFTVASDAAVGNRSVTVQNPAPGGGASAAVDFTVNQAMNPVPVLASVAPSTGMAGSAVPVTLTGTGFMVGTTVQVSGSGVTVSAVNVQNATTITATLTIAPGAALGARDVTVTNPAPGGGISEAVAFTVEAAPNPAPVLTSVAPSTGTAGSAVPVTLTGSGFMAGSTVQVSGSGVTVSAVNVQNATTITATLTIAPGAALGARDVTVTNPAPGGGTSGAVAFTVQVASNPMPVLTSVVPPLGMVGSSVSVTLTGSGFMAGSTVQVSGSGVAVSLVSVQSATTITAMFTLAADAVLGARQVSVTNPAPGGGTSGTAAFTVGQLFVNTAPTLDAISDRTFLHTAAEQVIPLTGIGPGDAQSQNLTITATTSDPLLIPTLTVDYTSPQAAGTLRLRNDPTRTGSATVRVRIKDDGGIANGGVDSLVRTFTVNVLLDTDLEEDLRPDTPTEYRLESNYPNPFNPSTVIPFTLPVATPVRIAVYDVNGRLRGILLDQEMGAGRHEISFDAGGLSSGLYLVRMSGPLGVQSIRVLLVK